MSVYGQSAAITGRGSVIAINTGTVGSPVFTQIFEITDAKNSGRQAQTLKATNLQSTQEEFITSLADPGMFDCSGNYVSGDPGQVAVDTAFNASGTAAALKQFKVTLPLQGTQAISGDTYSFFGVIQEWAPLSSINAGTILVFSLKIKISGQWTKVSGS